MDRIPLKQVPLWLWFVLLFTGGVSFLVWHQYANNDADEEWNPDTQPPQMLSPASINLIGNIKHLRDHKPGDSFPIRARTYPANLVESAESIIGEF